MHSFLLKRARLQSHHLCVKRNHNKPAWLRYAAFVHRHHDSGCVKEVQLGAGYDQVRKAKDELVLQTTCSIIIYCFP